MTFGRERRVSQACTIHLLSTSITLHAVFCFVSVPRGLPLLDVAAAALLSEGEQQSSHCFTELRMPAACDALHCMCYDDRCVAWLICMHLCPLAAAGRVVEGPLLHMQALHEDDTSRAADTIFIASDQLSTRLARGNMYAVLLPLSPCRMFLWCCMHIFIILLVARPPVAYRSSSFLIALRSVHTDPAVCLRMLIVVYIHFPQLTAYVRT